jgi:hypothetical protein
MRTVGGVLSGLVGAYLLWMTFKFARVLLIVDTMPGEGAAIAVMVGTALVGAALLYLAWRLIRKRRV